MPWPSATDIGPDSLPPSATLNLYPPDGYQLPSHAASRRGFLEHAITHFWNSLLNEKATFGHKAQSTIRMLALGVDQCLGHVYCWSQYKVAVER
jgi:hypothetical protein